MEWIDGYAHQKYAVKRILVENISIVPYHIY